MRLVFMCVLEIFFFKRKTAYERRISGWSADLSSSDRGSVAASCSARCRSGRGVVIGGWDSPRQSLVRRGQVGDDVVERDAVGARREAAGRQRRVEGQRGHVPVLHGVVLVIQKQKDSQGY